MIATFRRAAICRILRMRGSEYIAGRFPTHRTIRRMPAFRAQTLQHGFFVPPASRLGVWGSALLLHGVAAAALVLAWPQASPSAQPANPIEARLLTPEKPPEPVKPPPPRKPPPPAATLPPPVAPAAPPPVLATPTLTETAMVAPPPPPTPVAIVEAAPPRPVVIASPAPVAPEPLIEARFDADYLANPTPAYPMASRRLGEEGTVHLRVHVGPAGNAMSVQLKSSCGYPRLDQSALETVARWRFVPARRGATPVASWVVVPIIFSLT